VRILLASSEVHPYSKTGGLADMVACLGKALNRLGHDITILTPLHRGIADAYRDLKRVTPDLMIPLGHRRVPAELWSRQVAVGERVLFVGQPEYFDRPALYTQNGSDYPDNAERFVFFSKAVAAVALAEVPGFDVVHVHDWQTALVPMLMKHERERAGRGNGTRTCMTIHNLAYQGVFPATAFGLTGLPPGWFNLDTVEFYGHFSALKAGITAADLITTVSPRYAREITTQEFGCGLDGLLRCRQSVLHGILNGVDYEEWTTSRNPYLAADYGLEHLEGKTANKLALQKELGLEIAPDQPLFGSVTRLVEQKGVDLMLGALEEMIDDRMQFALLGSGDPGYEQQFKDLTARYPGKVAVRIGYDNRLAHRIEAASDFYLMPSRFEPCGLNQLYSLRYGAIPIVRAVGGLDDSVVDINESEARANGIKFCEPTVAALAHGIRKALALHEVPELMSHYRHNGMSADFSCQGTAQHYLKLYTPSTRLSKI
jgi:starch synthase